MKLQRLSPKPQKLKPSPSLCSFRLELEFGHAHIAGIDEVGRGCLAGPVVAAGVVFPADIRRTRCSTFKRITDSKALKHDDRVELAEFIRTKAIVAEIAWASVEEIDQYNILKASLLAARRVAEGLEKKLGKMLDLILIDGPFKIPGVKNAQHPVISGDAVSRSIAAASILAKVYRDEWMGKLAIEYPQYRLEAHKGYATPTHRRAVEEHGLSAIHRRSFFKLLKKIEVGREAEDQVEKFLESLSYKILFRNWRVRGGEIDVVAERNGELHFIEVRSRSKPLDLQYYFSEAKQVQFRKAVNLFLLHQREFEAWPIRLHLICLANEKIESFWDVFQF